MPTPTTTTTASTDTTAVPVQQAPRTALEFEFAHRLLRKLVQDSTFFPVESTQRDYVWFPPRPRGGDDTDTDGDHRSSSSVDDKSNADADAAIIVSNNRNKYDDTCNLPSAAISTIATTTTEISTTNNNITASRVSVTSHPDENQQRQCHAMLNENSILQTKLDTKQIQRPPTQPKRQRRRRTVSTPLFLDYCLRNQSHTIDADAANNHHRSTHNMNMKIHRRHTLNNHNNHSYNNSNSSINNNNLAQITEAEGPVKSSSSTLQQLRPASPLSFCSYNSNSNSKYSSCNSYSTVISTRTADDDDDDDESDADDHHVSTDNVTLEVMSKSSGGCNSSASVVTTEEGGEAVHPMVMAELSDGTTSGALTLNGCSLEQNEDCGSLNAVKAVAPILSAAASSTQEATNNNDTVISKPTVKKHVVHCIHEKDLEFGTILGSGGFGQVRLARIKHDEKSSPVANGANSNANGVGAATDAATNNQKTDATSNATRTKAATEQVHNKYYAMKYLSPQKMSPPPPPFTTNNEDDDDEELHYVSKFERGIADLAMEARYLSVLSHENIVTLWFVSEGRLEEVFNCGGSGGKGGSRRRRRSSVKHHHKKNNDTNSNSNSSKSGSDTNNNSNGQGEPHQHDRHHHHHHQHGYFLLLDALHETLHQRISNSYIPQAIDTPLRIYYPTTKKSYSDNNTHIAKGQLAQRLTSLRSIAVALVYLHEECNLIYRDLKPSNIGFYRKYHGGNGLGCTCGHDVKRGVQEEKQEQQSSSSSSSKCTCNYTDIPKLFDFGLAKELKSKFRKAHPAHSPDDPPTFKLTSATGSRRYMSPEVALRQPYNHKADVYSFGMVLYQISALVVPFQGMAMKNHEQIVAREGLRPDVTIPSKDSSVRRTRDFRRHYSKEKDKGKRSLMLSKLARCVWPEGLNELITECWDDDMRKRPEMREVIERLDVFIEELNQHSSEL